MNLRLLSDLHLEFYRNVDEIGLRDDVDCDVVVLAGDICTGVRGIEWAADVFSEPTIYVMGNHEYYGRDAEELLPQARARAAELGVHLLERDEVRIGGTRFLGCALWSGFQTDDGIESPLIDYAQVALNDFRMIRDRGGILMPGTMAHWYAEASAWLKYVLDPADPAVVVTHFPPTWRTVNPKFDGDAMTPYFHTNVEHLMGAAAPVWLYGHNHYSANEVVETESGRTLVCSNQLGYPGEDGGFVGDYVIEV